MVPFCGQRSVRNNCVERPSCACYTVPRQPRARDRLLQLGWVPFTVESSAPGYFCAVPWVMWATEAVPETQEDEKVEDECTRMRNFRVTKPDEAGNDGVRLFGGYR